MISHVIFPKEFVATKWDGYFWNLKDKQLYSIKIKGVLRPLKLQKTHIRFLWKSNFMLFKDLPASKDGIVKYYSISINGKSKMVPYENLCEHFENKFVHDQTTIKVEEK